MRPEDGVGKILDIDDAAPAVIADRTSPSPVTDLSSRRSRPDAVQAEAFVWLPDREPDPRTLVREVHHDLRQPLAAVRALVFAARTDPNLSELARHCLERIADETDRMLELCRHVLEGGGRPRSVDLARLARDAASECELATGCVVRVDADPVEAVVDDVELRRALVNLLDNATRAAGPGGSVCVTVRRAADAVWCTVEDSGPGFAHGAPGAASLGLSIVCAAAARLGGRVEVEQGRLGGALVRLVLPLPGAG